ncbi:S-locus glycoprotein [Parasponia andersonii]|uniref:S-locus glycoprotein n=1 Tax=Parasponia andersonii TaxID=3476 RepID=A0A2P5B4R0_PARAD|nr:S-locus glycoprotein [Parasponia andersonii]
MKKICYLVIFFLYAIVKFCLAADTITPVQSIVDGSGTLVSSENIFELGFFSPGKAQYRYLGIWYKTTPDVIVWVANRDNPLTDSYGESKVIIWSSNSSSSRVGKNLVAQLLDSGNLVLREVNTMNSQHYLWQSFDYPTDTHLPGLKLGWDFITGLERYLTSWKSADDPSTGDFTYRISINGLPQQVLALGSIIKFRSGVWNGVRFSDNFRLVTLTDKGLDFTYCFNENESYYMSEPLVKSAFITRLTLNQYSGLDWKIVVEKTVKLGSANRLQELSQGGITVLKPIFRCENRFNSNNIVYSRPYDPFDNYGYCGANAICRINGDPICDCLERFTPRSKQKWDVLNLSKGCRRKTPLTYKKGDGFIELKGVKLPDLLDFRLDKNMSLKECELACLKDCSCSAYANSDSKGGGSGCLMWFGDLIDVRDFCNAPLD